MLVYAIIMELQQYIKTLINYIGDNADRPELVNMPDKLLHIWKTQLFNGYDQDPSELFASLMPQQASDIKQEIIILKNIEFMSMCEHHAMPFFGIAHIAYIPDQSIIGLSKLALLLNIYAKRLQIQERLGTQIIDTLDKYLQPLGSACIIEAHHTCMSSQQIYNQSSKMLTGHYSGIFQSDIQYKQELLALI